MYKPLKKMIIKKRMKQGHNCNLKAKFKFSLKKKKISSNQ